MMILLKLSGVTVIGATVLYKKTGQDIFQVWNLDIGATSGTLSEWKPQFVCVNQHFFGYYNSVVGAHCE